MCVKRERNLRGAKGLEHPVQLYRETRDLRNRKISTKKNGAIRKIKGFVFHALKNSNFTRCTDALVIPQPGQVVSKSVVKRQGGKISSPKTICTARPIAKYKARITTGVSFIYLFCNGKFNNTFGFGITNCFL